jgi:hypothetical protein
MHALCIAPAMGHLMERLSCHKAETKQAARPQHNVEPVPPRTRRRGQCLHIRQGPNKTALGKHSACLNETLRLQEHNKAAILTSLHYILRNPAARVWPSTWVQEPSTCDQTYVVSGDKSWGNKRLQQHTLKDRTTVTAQEQPQERSKSKLGSWHKPS